MGSAVRKIVVGAVQRALSQVQGGRGKTQPDMERHWGLVPANRADRFSMRYHRNQIACVWVVCDSALTISVFDSRGRHVAASHGRDGTCSCYWNPRHTETYTIRISNQTDAVLPYQLYTNGDSR